MICFVFCYGCILCRSNQKKYRTIPYCFVGKHPTKMSEFIWKEAGGDIEAIDLSKQKRLASLQALILLVGRRGLEPRTKGL